MVKFTVPGRTSFHVSGIILDVDGTLRNTGMAAYFALCRSIIELGGEAPFYDEFVREYLHDGAEYYWRRGVSRTVTREEIHVTYYRHVGDHDVEPPFPDVQYVLNFLAHELSIPLFVVSGHNRERLINWFEEHKLPVNSQHIVGGAGDKSRHIREVCAMHNIDSRHSMYIGDLGLDMRAHREVCAPDHGVTVGISGGHDGARIALLEEGADVVIAELHEILRYFPISR